MLPTRGNHCSDAVNAVMLPRFLLQDRGTPFFSYQKYSYSRNHLLWELPHSSYVPSPGKACIHSLIYMGVQKPDHLASMEDNSKDHPAPEFPANQLVFAVIALQFNCSLCPILLLPRLSMCFSSEHSPVNLLHTKLHLSIFPGNPA